MRRALRAIFTPFRLLWDALAEVLRLVRWVAYPIAHFVGSGPGVITIGVVFGLYFAQRARYGVDRNDAAIFYVLIAFGVACRLYWRKLKPGPRRVRPPKPVKAQPIPVVRGSTAQADDTNEAAIVARMPANLRALLAEPKRPAKRDAAE